MQVDSRGYFPLLLCRYTDKHRRNRKGLQLRSKSPLSGVGDDQNPLGNDPTPTTTPDVEQQIPEPQSVGPATCGGLEKHRDTVPASSLAMGMLDNGNRDDPSAEDFEPVIPGRPGFPPTIKIGTEIGSMPSKYESLLEEMFEKVEQLLIVGATNRAREEAGKQKIQRVSDWTQIQRLAHISHLSRINNISGVKNLLAVSSSFPLVAYRSNTLLPLSPASRRILAKSTLLGAEKALTVVRATVARLSSESTNGKKTAMDLIRSVEGIQPPSSSYKVPPHSQIVGYGCGLFDGGRP